MDILYCGMIAKEETSGTSENASKGRRRDREKEREITKTTNKQRKCTEQQHRQILN